MHLLHVEQVYRINLKQQHYEQFNVSWNYNIMTYICWNDKPAS